MRVFTRAALPVAFAVAAGAIGFVAGTQASGDAVAQNRDASAAVMAEVQAQAALIAALGDRLKSLEEAPRADAVVKPAIEILARRVDEIARTQTAALMQTRTRLERAEGEINQKIDRVVERVDRVERQVSSPGTVGSIPGGSTMATRQAPAQDGPIRGYLLREVFRDGGALVEGREGLVEVYSGSDIPGAGRVRAVERRDGRWVVVTSTGVIETYR